MLNLAVMLFLACMVWLFLSEFSAKLIQFVKRVDDIENKFSKIFGDDASAKKEIREHKEEIAELKKERDKLKDDEIVRLNSILKDINKRGVK